MSSLRFMPFLVPLLLLAAPVAAQTTPPRQEEDKTPTPTAGHSGKFFVQSADGNNRLQFDGLLHSRYVFTRSEASDEDGNITVQHRSRFLLRRARLGLRGHVVTEELGYRLQLEFGRGSAGLLDYYADYRLHDQLRIRFGQDRKPFSRSLLTPASKLQFVDRPFTETEFAAGRDIGVLVHNGYLKAEGFEYAVGFYNGTGTKSTFDGSKFSNVPEKMRPSVVVRLGYNFGETKGYEGSDRREDQSPALAIGTSGSADFDANDSNDGKLTGSVDASFKANGFSSSGAFYASIQQDGPRYGDRAEPTLGAYYQAGGFLLENLLETAARGAWVRDLEEQAERLDLAATVNVFIHGSALKWQTDGTLSFETGGDNPSGYEIRSQVQLSF